MVSKQIKSKERLYKFGEAFTGEREVIDMCNLVSNEAQRIDSRFFEPACGKGQFLSEVEKRKLSVVSQRYKKNQYDWERYSLLALGSIYGVDILFDNVQDCQEALFDIWDKTYTRMFKKRVDDNVKKSARFIISKNIVCGNALSLMLVDEKQKEKNEPIVFPEWTFPNNDAIIRREDFYFSEILNNEAIKSVRIIQEGIFVSRYYCNYRRLGENE